MKIESKDLGDFEKFTIIVFFSLRIIIAFSILSKEVQWKNSLLWVRSNEARLFQD